MTTITPIPIIRAEVTKLDKDTPEGGGPWVEITIVLRANVIDMLTFGQDRDEIHQKQQKKKGKGKR